MSSASTRFLQPRKGGSLARLISIPHDNVSALSGASDQKPEAYSSIGAGCQYYSAIQIKQTSHKPPPAGDGNSNLVASDSASALRCTVRQAPYGVVDKCLPQLPLHRSRFAITWFSGFSLVGARKTGGGGPPVTVKTISSPRSVPL